MKLTIAIILIAVGIYFSTIHAKQWKTDFFVINLPDEMVVETDSSERLFGTFGEQYPPVPPILIIEFSKEHSKDELLNDLNEDLKSQNEQMKKISCTSACELYFNEHSSIWEEKEYLVHQYLMVTSNLIFIVTYVNKVHHSEDRTFITDILDQLKKQSN